MSPKSLNINILLTKTPYKQLSPADRLTYVTYSIGLITGILIYIVNIYLDYQTPKRVALFVIAAFLIGSQLYFNLKKHFLSSVALIACLGSAMLYLCYNVGLTTSYFMYGYVLLCTIPFMNKRDKHYLRNGIILSVIILIFSTLSIILSPQYNAEKLIIEYANQKLLTNSILSFGLFITFAFILVIASSNIILALIRAKTNAEKQKDAKTRVLSNLGHELRTQLSSIHGITQLLLDQNENDELNNSTFSQYTETLEVCSKQMLFLVDDILDIHKIESGNFNLHNTPENLYNLLNQVTIPFKTKVLDKQLAFEVSIDPILKNNYVSIDASRLTQVLQNLISNAIKFTDKGFVKFSTKIITQSKEHTTLLFSVKDSGIGISDDNSTKVFDSFQQIRDENTTETGGTGLGLAISKTIIEKMGSQIHLNSSPEHGSDFNFTLILKNESTYISNAIKNIDNNNIESCVLTGKKILITEDNKISMLYASKLLAKNGAQILKAYNGKEAVKLTASNPDISIILLDLEMPEMNGFNAIQEIKKLNKSVKVIAFTANIPDDILLAKINRFNFDGFLAKPFKNEAMFSVLNQHLEL
ncbi:ATP-binding protein [uncultured Winogradskyella sp.]|uniref:hybrid sensor histidine kinase/response regulator n=1 Tax=uncultured Winogradskyella sp. TaxID=395353 RepID=UPI0026328BBB|nr:ATP-binding protein [uncultured Winogradskyella sp.]